MDDYYDINELGDFAMQQYKSGYKVAYIEMLSQLQKADLLYDSKEGIVEYLTFYIEGTLDSFKEG